MHVCALTNWPHHSVNHDLLENLVKPLLFMAVEYFTFEPVFFVCELTIEQIRDDLASVIIRLSLCLSVCVCGGTIGSNVQSHPIVVGRRCRRPDDGHSSICLHCVGILFFSMRYYAHIMIVEIFLFRYEQNKTSRRAQPTAPTSISPTPLYRIGSPGGGGGNLVPSANSVPINRIQVPLLFNKTRPQVSMYKFIKSRGKQVTSDNSLTGNYYIECDTKYRPPKFVTADFYRKRLSAFDKIQEELRENKQREDELR